MVGRIKRWLEGYKDGWKDEKMAGRMKKWLEG